jgi:hypothetical protein
MSVCHSVSLSRCQTGVLTISVQDRDLKFINGNWPNAYNLFQKLQKEQKMSNLEVHRLPVRLRPPDYFQTDNYLKGFIGTDMVKSLLERSGYTVRHYGYEYTLLDVMSKRTSKNLGSKTGRRIRKSPDLLVYDDQDIMLVEVKTRLTLPPIMNTREIESLKEFWDVCSIGGSGS